MVNWIIEKDVFQEGNPEKMIAIAESKGMAVKVVGYTPFGGELRDAGRRVYSHDSDLFPTDACVVAYGSINLVRRLLNERPWTPTAWMNLENLKCQSYYAHWGYCLLNRRYAMVPWAELPRVIDGLYSSLSEDGCLFLRPNDNTKVFSGTVVHVDDFEKWYERERDCYSPPPESLAVVARPQKIEAEWRIIVADGKVITSSMYKEAGKQKVEPGAPAGAIELADMLALHSWRPEKMHVIDVCLCPDGYRLLEIGSINSAGLYACDIEMVVDFMSFLAQSEHEEVSR